MALPTIQKTYEYTRINVPFIGGASVYTSYSQFWYLIKQILVAWGWELRGTCGYNNSTWQYALDGTDYWTSSDSLAWNTSTFANATWIVLRKPDAAGTGKDFELLIQQNAITTGRYDCSLIAMAFEPFVGGTSAFASPPKVASPVLGVNMRVLDTTTSQSGWYKGATTHNTVGYTNPWDATIHAIRSTDDAVQRIFVCNGNTVIFYMAAEKVKDPIDTWTHPFVFTCLRYPATFSNIFDGSGYSFAYDASGSNPTWFYTFHATEMYVDGAVGERITRRNDISGEQHFTPVGVFSNTVGKRGRHGCLYDLWFTATAAATTGDTYPDDTGLYAQFDNLVVPWNGAATVTV